MTKNHKVAVYGTLRPSNTPATHELVGYRMYNYYDRFPYIMHNYGSPDSAVMVNVLEVDDMGLEELDRYEGVDRGLYKRIKEKVLPLQEGEVEEVWVYVAGNIAPVTIDSGDWFDREKVDE